MDDLEQQLVAWVDAETEGVDPVTLDEVWDRVAPATGGTRGRPSRGALVVGIAAVVLLLGGLAFVYSARDRGPESVQSGPTTTTSDPAWVREHAVLPAWGWSVERPTTWSVQSWSLDCRPDTGYLVTNQPHELEPGGTGTGTGGCGVRWSEEDVSDPGFVGFELHLGDRDPTAPSIPRGPADTPLPIDLEAGPTTWIMESSTSGTRWTGEVSRNNDHALRVRAWAGADAPAADVAALHRIVRSLTWETPERQKDRGQGIEGVPSSAGLRTSTLLTCMIDRGYRPWLRGGTTGTVDGETMAEIVWADGDQDRSSYGDDHEDCAAFAADAGSRADANDGPWPRLDQPSQSPEDAERDHVVPALAALPLAQRAEAQRWFVTGEGTWALATGVAPAGGEGDACAIGDPAGTRGVDWICPSDYGEILLVDHEGRVLHAYPMPGVKPTWFWATEEAIYAGRTGDGAAPTSTLVRIDRTTYESQVLVFPHPGSTQERVLPNWSEAPAGAVIGDLVRVGDETPDDSRTLVNSWIGVTSIDLPAIEQLFA